MFLTRLFHTPNHRLRVEFLEHHDISTAGLGTCGMSKMLMAALFAVALISSPARAGFFFLSGGTEFQAFSKLDTFTPPASAQLGVNDSGEYAGTFSNAPTLTGTVRAVGSTLSGSNYGGTNAELYVTVSGRGNYDPYFATSAYASYQASNTPMTMTMDFAVEGYLAPGDIANLLIFGFGGTSSTYSFQHTFFTIYDQPGRFSDHFFWQAGPGTLSPGLPLSSIVIDVTSRIQLSIARRTSTGETSYVNIDPGVRVAEGGAVSLVPAPPGFTVWIVSALCLAVPPLGRRVRLTRRKSDLAR